MLVGPRACRLRLDPSGDVAVVRVRAEEIVPVDDDLATMVGYAAEGTFHGADADRWRVLEGPALREETQLLWACAQVQAAGLGPATSGWDKVLVVGWTDEPGLVPAVRAVVEGERPVTVLLGGALDGEHPAGAQSNRSVLAHLVRQGQIATVIWNPEPQEVLDVALDAARHPDPIRIPRGKPVDIGPLLELPGTWCVPAAPVHFFALVHVPMGYARRLPDLAVLVATWKALKDLVGGPPVDVAGAGVRSADHARARLPDPAVHVRIERRLAEALEAVRLEGDEPLVEQIDRQLRPALAEVAEVVAAVAEVERARLRHLRAFSACGIHYTVQNLSARLDAIADAYPQSRLEEVRILLAGEGAPGDDGPEVHVTAWRRAFAGLPSRVAARGAPGWQLARSLVQQRLRLLRSELATGVARHLEVLVARALDPEAEPSSAELRALKDRAERVRDALADALEHLEQRIRIEADEAVRNDRFVRWAAGDGLTLFQHLATRLGSLDVSRRLDRLATDVLSRRALGMAEDRDYELWLQDLAREVHRLPLQGEPGPSYEQVLLLLLQGRDPPVLRQAIAQSQGAEVELHLERPVEPALMNWLTATGMLVVVAPRLKTCAIYWQRLEKLDVAVAERLRRGFTEHRTSDLLLPAVGGDELVHIVNLVRAAVYLLVGLAVGVLEVRRLREGLQVHLLAGRNVGLPTYVLLPHGALHVFAHDEELLVRLRARVEEGLAALARAPDAPETVRKLVELAALGPSSTLAAQIGLYGARFEHLEHAVNALLQRCANLAIASMAEALHSSELEPLVRAPRRRTLVDVAQLAPSGG